MKVFFNQIYPLNPFLVSTSEDIILVPNRSESQKDVREDYIDAYYALGMQGTIVRYNPKNLKNILRELNDGLFTPYLLNDSVEALVQELGLTTDFYDIGLVRKFEDKTIAKELFLNLGCNCLPSLSVEDAQKDSSPFEILVLKETTSLGGLGNTKVSKAGITAFNFQSDKKYIIEPFVPGDSFCSIYFIGETIDNIGTTKQIIKNDFFYGGNIYPASNVEQIQYETDKVAQRLHKIGFRGWVGIDSKRNNAVYLLEINPRLNGSTLPLLRRRELDYSYMACSVVYTGKLPTAKEFEKTVTDHDEVIPFNIGFGFNSVGFVIFGKESLEKKVLPLIKQFKKNYQ